MVFWFIVELVLLVATTVLTALLAKSPAGKASSLGDFQAPTAEEGRVIPVIFGTCLAKGPNVVWYGDLKVVPIRKGATWLLAGGGAKTVGYKYYMGMQMVICHGPIDNLVTIGFVQNQSGVHVGDGQVTGVSVPPSATDQTITVTLLSPAITFSVVGSISGSLGVGSVASGFFSSQVNFHLVQGPTTPFQVGDQFVFDTVLPSAIFANTKAVTYTASSGGLGILDITMNSPNLFGGEQAGGGIAGPAKFYSGKPGQAPNAYLSAHLPGVNGVAPAYEKLCYFVLEQSYVGTTITLNDMAFAIQNCPDPLGTHDHNIGGDANPAWIIWMWMTNTVYGLGIPALRFDANSFKAAAATLKTEKMGMSIQQDGETSGDQVISEILRHIDAVLFTDPATGLWTLNLVRADYDPATLPELAQDDIVEPPELSRVSWEETLNECKVKYIDRSLFFTERVTQAHESANHAVRGMVGSATFDFHGFSNSGLGQMAATRELKTHSYPLMQGKVIAKRIAWNFRMGGVFRLTWPALGIVRMVVRISAINYGVLENGRIEINCVEDIFAISSTGYQPPPFPGWINPAGPPGLPVAQRLLESPYVMTTPTTDRIVLALAARGDSLTTGFIVQSSGIDVADQQPFIPYGVLLLAYPLRTAMDDSVGFYCAAVPQVDLNELTSIDPALRLQGQNIFLIDDEILAFSTVTFNNDGTVTIAGVLRGLYDTVPADHALGAAVWFLGAGPGKVNQVAFPIDLSLSVKCLPSNNYGTVAAGSVTAVTLTTDSRAKLPYPPGNVLVNSFSYPVTVLGDAVMTWADRNRVTQGQDGLAQTASSVAGGVEGNYTIEILIDSVLIRTLTGQTGNTFTYTAAQRAIDNADLTKLTSIRIKPVNGALVGTSRTVTFLMVPAGGGFGLAFGIFGG